jgi:hypothetical protein
MMELARWFFSSEIAPQGDLHGSSNGESRSKLLKPDAKTHFTENHVAADASAVQPLIGAADSVYLACRRGRVRWQCDRRRVSGKARIYGREHNRAGIVAAGALRRSLF